MYQLASIIFWSIRRQLMQKLFSFPQVDFS